ncbi:hypothetical protein V6N13_109495 [Hibiscus sabdariffa]
MEVVAQHKWEKFAKHPSDVNATLVKEFYANIAEPKQNSVFVREFPARSDQPRQVKDYTRSSSYKKLY